MKKILTILFILLLSKIILAQTKVDEWEPLDTDSESIRIGRLFDNMMKESESKWLVIVYSGENKDRLGNILEHVKKLKWVFSHLSTDRSDFLKRISFIVTPGKERFSKEIWVAKNGEKFPEYAPTDLSLDNINEKYLYAETCLSCEPADPWFRGDALDLEHYSKTLQKNMNYEGLIVIENGTTIPFVIDDKLRWVSPRRYAGEWRKLLTLKDKIENSRIKIKIVKPQKDFSSAAYFYIVPKIIKNNKK